MTKSFYGSIAQNGIQNNKQLFAPYVTMNVFIIAMFYMIHNLAQHPDLKNIGGGDVMSVILGFGVYVVGIFSVLAVFYTNSFLMKRRMKEIGLYNILGLAKRHIARVLSLETFMIALDSIGLGLLTGVVFSKLLYMVLLRILQFPVKLDFNSPVISLVTTTLFFGVLFLAVLIYNLMRIHLKSPIELVRESAVGEREPKASLWMTIMGLMCMISGYVLAVNIESPLKALYTFFIAVLLVIVGTYALFTTGSIFLLKKLRALKPFYYQTKHFIVISGMLYRMKQNAVGLSNIAILSAMLIVTLSTTISLYAGLDDAMKNRYPQDVSISMSQVEMPALVGLEQWAAQLPESIGYRLDNFSYLESTGFITKKDAEPGRYSVLQDKSFDSDSVFIELIPYDLYVNYFALESSQGIQLSENEVLLYKTGGSYGLEQIEFGDQTLKVEKEIKGFRQNSVDAGLVESFTLVLKDKAAIQNFYKKVQKKDMEGFDVYFGYDEKNQSNNPKALKDVIMGALKSRDIAYTLAIRSLERMGFLQIYGGLLFLGLFLGSLFLVMTVMIMYYKQISEGFDDKIRFETMQKVGMNHSEIKKSIQSQTILVFFLPLLVASCHVLFAFNMMRLLLGIFNFTNVALFSAVTALVMIVFAVFYYVVYQLTARTYFRIVQWH